MSKGSKPRAVDGEKYRSAYERIFAAGVEKPGQPTEPIRPGQIVDGHRYLGDGGFQTENHGDCAEPPWEQ
jgi:hypothetical protein